jgi:hypothetical protein
MISSSLASPARAAGAFPRRDGDAELAVVGRHTEAEIRLPRQAILIVNRRNGWVR